MPRPRAAATAFSAVADPTRRGILEILTGGELPVSEIQRRLGSTSQSALSQHLGVLRQARLVTERREGRHRIYRVRPEPLREIADWVRHFEQFWDGRLDRLGHYLNRKHAR